jgi:hypothetical protein
MKYTLYIITFLFVNLALAQDYKYDEAFPLEDYNFVLGTNSLGSSYKFTNDSKIIEQAKQTRALGSNIFKTSITNRNLPDYGYKRKDAVDMMDVLYMIPDYEIAMKMDFKYYFFWVHTATGIKWKKEGINKRQEKTLYKEMYALAKYLLKEYSGTGKTFFIGNWEGDWLLHPQMKKKSIPTPDAVANMTKWLQIRQRAIDDAKAKVKHKDVNLYYYVEVNLVNKGLEGKVCLTRDVLPHVNPDYVSYSSYESSKKKDYETNKEWLVRALDYIESQLQPKEGLPFQRRVFIGEYGGHAYKDKPATFLRQFNNVKDIMQISLELDLPFALHWQLYNNEYRKKDGASKNMSLINEEGEKMPVYFLHQNYYKQMNAYLKSYKEENGNYPDYPKFKEQALSVLNKVYDDIIEEHFNKEKA